MNYAREHGGFDWNGKYIGGPTTTGTYDWQRKYLGDDTVNYLNAHQNDPIPSWANADTSKMSPYCRNTYDSAKSDYHYWQNKRWENLGRY